MPVYSEKVMEHFMHPRNVGEIEDADGIGEVGNPVCGDMMTFYIKVKDDHLEDVKFKTFGCGAAIAVSSMVSEMAKGKSLKEVMKITPRSVADELEGLPKQKFHCSNLGAQALHKAIENYHEKQKKQPQRKPINIEAEKKEAGECLCPHCNQKIDSALFPFCQACQVTIRHCPSCGKPVAAKLKKCPGCGAEIAN